MTLGEVNTQILTLIMLDVFMYYTLPQFLSNSFKIFQLLACIYKQSRKPFILRSAGSLEASWSCSTLFQNSIYQEFSMEKGLLIKAEQLKEKMVTFLLYKNIYISNSLLIYLTLSAVSLAYREMTSWYDTHIIRKSIGIRYDFNKSLLLYSQSTRLHLPSEMVAKLHLISLWEGQIAVSIYGGKMSVWKIVLKNSKCPNNIWTAWTKCLK